MTEYPAALASTSAHDVASDRKQPRKRADGIAWSMPGTTPPKFAISDRYGDPLGQSYVLLARSLYSFDYELIRRVKTVYQKIKSTADEPQKNEIASRLAELDEIQMQWKEIESHERRFNQTYLKDPKFISIWTEGLKNIKIVLNCKKGNSDQVEKRKRFIKILLGYEKHADNLLDALKNAAAQGILDAEIQDSIQERWMRLDDTLNWYHRDVNEPRYIRTWHDVSSLIKEASQKFSESGNGKNSDRPYAAINSSTNSVDNTLVLWSTFFGSAITSIALFALGYAYSPHVQGSTNDPDFWFLAQGCITQIFGLVASALLEWKRGHLSTWRWLLPTGIAGLCSVTAAPLYVLAPTEWSSFLALVASATQSFMILQHYVSNIPP